MLQYGENKDGVHFMNPDNAEYTLCGDAFDIGSEIDYDDSVENVSYTKKNIITCERCIFIIKACKKVKIKEE